jgi:hypothetical protein
MRIKFNDKIYRLKEIESGVDSLMELVEEPKYNHGDFLMTRNRLAFIFDREGENGNAYHLFATDMDVSVEDDIQECGVGIRYCGRLKDALVADQKATKAIHEGLKSIGKLWNSEKKCVEDIPKRKFKKGDKVRIKDGVSSKTHWSISPSFVNSMDKFIGKELKVEHCSKSGFVKCDGYYFSEDWLEPYTEEPKKGDLAIFWDNCDEGYAIISLYDKKFHEYHYDISDTGWDNAIKFESKDQFEKVLRGEI